MYDRIPGVPPVNTPLSWQCWLARQPVELEELEAVLLPGFGLRVGRAIAAAFRHDVFNERYDTLALDLGVPPDSIRLAIRQVRRELAEDTEFRDAVEEALGPVGIRRFTH